MTLQVLTGELNDEQQDNLPGISGRQTSSFNDNDVIDISKIEAGRMTQS
jgi:hypothetical protein